MCFYVAGFKGLLEEWSALGNERLSREILNILNVLGEAGLKRLKCIGHNHVFPRRPMHVIEL